MAATMQWLEEYRGGRLAMSLVFDGYDLVVTTLAGSDLTNLAARFAADTAAWTLFSQLKSGLQLVGDVQQSISLYSPEIEPETIDVTIVDHDDTLLGSLLLEGNEDGARTYLTDSVAAGPVSSIDVISTADFPASGYVFIGHEQIFYGSKTATSFDNLTRGINSFLTTDAGGSGAGAALYPAHLVDDELSPGPTTSPSVTDYPRTWYGRYCTLILHVYDPVTGQWSKPSESRQFWTGRIQNYRDNGDGTISITLKNAMDLLHRPITGTQWQAQLNGGVYIGENSNAIAIYNSATSEYLLSDTLPDLATGEMHSHEEVARSINEQLATWATGGFLHTGDSVSLELVARMNLTPVYMFTMRTASTAVTGTNKIQLYLPRGVWAVLGFGSEDGNGQDGTDGVYEPTAGDFVYSRTFTRTTTAGTLHQLRAKLAPIIYWPTINFDQGGTVTVLDNEAGEFVEQTDTDINARPGSNGAIQMGDRIFAVRYTTPPSQFRVDGELDKRDGLFKYVFSPGTPVGEGPVRLGQATEAPLMRQVWFEGPGEAGTKILRLLLSTGTPGYNHADYDYYDGEGFGLGIPACLIDIESWEALNEVEIRLALTEPKPFYEVLEAALAVSGRYIVWKSTDVSEQPKLTVTRPSTDSSYQSTWVLDEANKAGAGPGMPDRTTVERTPDGLFNRFVLKYGVGFGNVDRTVTVEAVSSQSDYGRRRTVTIEAPNVTNAESLFASTVAPAIAYFSRPLAIASRTIDASLLRMAPGDSCSFSDNNVANPLTGVRGETLYGWVLSTKFNLATGSGSCEVVFLPEKAPGRTAPWSPSARVDETAGGGGYNAGTKTLTLRANEFGTMVISDRDVERFAVGQQVHVYQLDEGTTPLEWDDEVASINAGANTMTLVTGLAGWDSTKLYMVEARAINDVVNQQRNYAFMADTSFSTGYSDPEAYEYGTDEHKGRASVSKTETDGMFEPFADVLAAGEPASVHKVNYLARGVNSLDSKKTRTIYLNEGSDEVTFNGVGVGSSDPGQIVYTAFVPFYGHPQGTQGPRKIAVRARLRCDTVGVAVRFYSSDLPPTGLTFVDGPGFTSYNEVNFNTASTSYVWSSEATMTPVLGDYGDSMRGTWITIELRADGFGYLGGFTVRETEK